MTEVQDKTDQGATRASKELDGFAKQLAEWNSVSRDARVLASADRHPRRAAGLPANLATEWFKKATCRSAALARAICSLERDLTRQRRELLEAQRLERQAAIAAVVGVMRRLGITVEDLVGQAQVAVPGLPKDMPKSSSPMPVHYMGPQGQLWMGHGRRPKWLKQFLAAGGQLEDLMASRVLDAESA